MNRGANYSSNPDLINLITLTKPNMCARAIQQPKTKHDDDLHRRARKKKKRQREGRKNVNRKKSRRERRKIVNEKFFFLLKLMFCYTLKQQLLTSKTKCV